MNQFNHPSEETKQKMVAFFMKYTVPLILADEEEKKEGNPNTENKTA